MSDSRPVPIRVLDLTRLLPGPYATRVLAELGAEVIKIESPPGGDYARYSPPLAGDPPTSGLFREINAGKKSVFLDLKTDAAKVALRALAREADVLVDGFRPGVLARLGLDPAALLAENPRLIYAALTGFGLDGPDRDRAGHDIGYVARAGILGLTGPRERPQVLGTQVADLSGALFAVIGILAALHERERTGRGRVVDVSLVEAALAMNTLNLGNLHAGATVRRGEEILDGSRPCYGVYETRDGKFLAVGALEPKFWMAFLGVLGLDELAMNGLDGGEEGQRVRAQIEAKLKERTRAEWLPLFEAADACVEPVLELEEVEEDPHLRARRVQHPGGFVRSAARLTSFPSLAPLEPPMLPVPNLGADTRAVLSALDLPAEVRAAVLAAAPDALFAG